MIFFFLFFRTPTINGPTLKKTQHLIDCTSITLGSTTSTNSFELYVFRPHAQMFLKAYACFNEFNVLQKIN
jgi:hypothetical protein